MTTTTARTKERILDATIEVIADSGWGGVTTRRVAARAGVNNALVNYHFGTKSALLREAALAAIATLLAEPVRRLVEAPRLVDGLREFASWLRNLDIQRPAVAVFAEALIQAGRDEGLRELTILMLEDFRAEVARRIEHEISAGQAEDHVDPRAAAAGIAALLDGLAVHCLIDPDFDPQPGLEALVLPLLPAGAPR